MSKFKRGILALEKTTVTTEAGFTLIELLVIVGVIGMLAAIAIPQFTTYKKKGYEVQVKSDLRNAAVAEEAYSAHNFVYQNGALSNGTPPGFVNTANVSVTATVGTNDYQLSGSHSNCGSTTWNLTSVSGPIAGGPCP